MIHKGLGIEEGSSIFYRRMGQPLVSEIESIQAQVLEKGIQFVIVDSAGSCGRQRRGSVGDEPVLSSISAALRNLHITTSDHQPTKPRIRTMAPSGQRVLDQHSKERLPSIF